mmetsp:Transcript_24482/g.38178  ORF Transcript_24482/g.38178 Transcript_24482/m.38178 type:complete len:131 (-) Transcript_24482:113-505(-)
MKLVIFPSGDALPNLGSQGTLDKKKWATRTEGSYGFVPIVNIDDNLIRKDEAHRTQVKLEKMPEKIVVAQKLPQTAFLERMMEDAKTKDLLRIKTKKEVTREKRIEKFGDTYIPLSKSEKGGRKIKKGKI